MEWVLALYMKFLPTYLQKHMPNKVLEGCQGGSTVPRTVLAPLTGPQVNVLGIHFRRGFAKQAVLR